MVMVHRAVHHGPAVLLSLVQGMGVRRLVRGDGSGGLRLVEVIQRLLRGAPLRSHDVVGPGERHVQDLRGREVLRVGLIQVIVALRVLCDTVVGAHGNLRRGHTCDLEAALLFYLGSDRLRGLRMQIQAVGWSMVGTRG
ncbi:hypothetical protein EYF80_010359 [Liparis tanakae]|uniref:Uncharacterized protein n=1 Tax=Liparis tanakae TaxID=230148 RepID=A0A4Z2INA3_9TELE|nr:hypothetical protein EYF80_010359 [Liparis tanakae]